MNKITLFLLPLLLFAHPHIEISDWKNPTVEDFHLLQEYLSHGERPELKWIHTRDGKLCSRRSERIKKFSIIDENSHKIPLLQTEFINTSPDDRECCILTYTSTNGKFSEGIDEIIRRLRRVGFKGHFLYRVGGWPYIEDGGLELFDVPYAFKPCALMEARKLGYKKVIWIDASMFPSKNLSYLFSHIEQNGMLFRKDPCPLAMIAHERFMKSMNMTLQEVYQTRHIMSGVVGFDFSNKKANKCLTEYYKAAQMREPFFVTTPCQAPLSVFIRRNGLLKGIFANGNKLFSESKNSYFVFCRSNWKNFPPKDLSE
ncbi:MAG: hypothetical protein SNF33_04145 [Candidatus Algichlamydia australiensis]|nr:hypothetical protein [Chlamydiales bacterium]